jgi:5-methylcytosine-specific restriction endonuclease McrA
MARDTLMTAIQFEHEEDRLFFSDLLCGNGESVDKYYQLFDFRPPSEKRKEFNRLRGRLLEQLITLCGRSCLLGYEGLCDLDSGIAVDHLIPLSSNKLNKEIRHLEAETGKKVATQSFGSNNIENLIVACCNCNNHKKHRFLDKTRIQEILRLKYSWHECG